MGGGGGNSNQVQRQEITQSALPEYARPYFEGLMQRAEANMTTPYQPYGQERIAGFTPEQQQVQQNILNQQTPGQFGAASTLATAAGLGSIAAGQYNPGQFNFDRVGSQTYTSPQMAASQTNYNPTLQNYSMQGPADVRAQQVTSQNMQGAQSTYNPNIQNYSMQGPADVRAQQVAAQNMQGAQTGYRPDLDYFQMQGVQQFGKAQADQYMSPFQQNVVNVQKREATRDARRGQVVQDLGASRQGTYGGSRQLLAGLERERNLGTQLGDIQARGSQAAYENAQQQFERDRAAGLTTGQQNLAAKLGVQQLATQTGMQTALANLSNEQQARVNNQAQQFQAQGMNADNALRAALSNQQAGLTVGQQNLASQLQTQELRTQTGMQTALANLSNEQQARVNNQAQQLQAQGMNAENALRAALSNQQAGLTVGQQNLEAQLQTQQLGTQTGMQTALANLDARSQANVQNLAAQLQTQGLNSEQAMRAALANQQAGLDTQRMGEQSRQFGSQQGLAGLAQANQSAQTLANIGGAQSQADLARFGQQTSTAAQQQALNQQRYDMQYQDFLRQRDYPMEQLQQYSSLLRGVPVTPNSTTTSYAPNASLGSQLVSGGLGAASIYNMANRAGVV